MNRRSFTKKSLTAMAGASLLTLELLLAARRNPFVWGLVFKFVKRFATFVLTQVTTEEIWNRWLRNHYLEFRRAIVNNDYQPNHTNSFRYRDKTFLYAMKEKNSQLVDFVTPILTGNEKELSPENLFRAKECAILTDAGNKMPEDILVSGLSEVRQRKISAEMTNDILIPEKLDRKVVVPGIVDMEFYNKQGGKTYIFTNSNIADPLATVTVDLSKHQGEFTTEFAWDPRLDNLDESVFELG